MGVGHRSNTCTGTCNINTLCIGPVNFFFFFHNKYKPLVRANSNKELIGGKNTSLDGSLRNHKSSGTSASVHCRAKQATSPTDANNAGPQ